MDSALQVLFLIYFNIGYAIANNVDYSNLNMEDVEKVKSITKELGPGYGEDWVYMPNGEGQPVVAYLKRAPVTKIYGFFENNVERGNDFNYEDELNFRLYTKENGLDYQNLSVANPDLLLESAFDPSKVTKLVTHGWNSGASTSTVTRIRDAYLEVEDVNIITIDWKRISDLDYITSSYETEPLGKYTAKLIDQLVDVKGASYSDMHMIGHSLGAHLCGFAGANVKGRLGRITGLDPAMPGFQIFSGDDGRLDKSDADFVDIIHTSAGFLGISISTGHADFYPNGGSLQNGCCCIAEIIDSCSHERSHIYFGESILQPDEFLAVPCDSYAQFKANQCGTDVVPMGEATPTTTRGNYYLSTTDNSPYGLGENGTMYIYYGI